MSIVENFHTLLNSSGIPSAPISTATVWEFLTSKSNCNTLFWRTQRRVILSKEVEGRVGVRSAAASVVPETAIAVTGRRVVVESALTHAVEPTLRARNVISPK